MTCCFYSDRMSSILLIAGCGIRKRDAYSARPRTFESPGLEFVAELPQDDVVLGAVKCLWAEVRDNAILLERLPIVLVSEVAPRHEAARQRDLRCDRPSFAITAFGAHQHRDPA